MKNPRDVFMTREKRTPEFYVYALSFLSLISMLSISNLSVVSVQKNAPKSRDKKGVGGWVHLYCKLKTTNDHDLF